MKQDKKIQAENSHTIYYTDGTIQKKHPQPTDTGNTVSSEWFWNDIDGDNAICDDNGFVLEAPNEQTGKELVNRWNNHDKLVSALKRLLPFVTDNVSGDLMELVNDTPQNAMDAAKELLNNISTK